MTQEHFEFYEGHMPMDLPTDAALEMIGLGPQALDTRLLAALLHPSGKLTAIIPDNASREDLLANLRLLCRAHEGADKMLRKINPVLGRILSVIQDSPDVYQASGCETFKEFMTNYVIGELGCARSSAYQSLRLVKAHPSLAIEKWVSIGANRLNVMARFTKEGEPSYEKYLAVAEQAKTDEDFIQWVHDKDLIDKGDLTRVNVIILADRNTAQQWRDFKANSEIQATAGSEDAGQIFSMMMAECSSWLSPDGPRHHAELPAIDDQAVLLWRCTACEHRGIVPPGWANATLDEMRRYISEAHTEAARECEMFVGDLIVSRGDV